MNVLNVSIFNTASPSHCRVGPTRLIVPHRCVRSHPDASGQNTLLAIIVFIRIFIALGRAFRHATDPVLFLSLHRAGLIPAAHTGIEVQLHAVVFGATVRVVFRRCRERTALGCGDDVRSLAVDADECRSERWYAREDKYEPDLDEKPNDQIGEGDYGERSARTNTAPLSEHCTGDIIRNLNHTDVYRFQDSCRPYDQASASECEETKLQSPAHLQIPVQKHPVHSGLANCTSRVATDQLVNVRIDGEHNVSRCSPCALKKAHSTCRLREAAVGILNAVIPECRQWFALQQDQDDLVEVDLLQDR